MLATEKADGRGESLGGLTAGFFSGSLCGCAVGGLLADRFSFDLTFGVGGGLLLMVLLGFVLAPNRAMRRRKPFWPRLIVREQASVDASLWPAFAPELLSPLLGLAYGGRRQGPDQAGTRGTVMFWRRADNGCFQPLGLDRRGCL